MSTETQKAYTHVWNSAHGYSRKDEPCRVIRAVDGRVQIATKAEAHEIVEGGEFFYTVPASEVSFAETQKVDVLAVLVKAITPRVAEDLEAAYSLDQHGEESFIWCQQNVLNPCWMPGMPISYPLHHWGYDEPEHGDGGLACEDCQIRAALHLARVGGAA